MTNQLKVRMVIFLILPWIVGVILAIWFGLGWFFLIEALRRCIIAVPGIYISLLRSLVGIARADEEKRLLYQKKVRLLYAWRTIVAVIWLILTVVVFLKINIRLISVFQ